MVQIDRDQLIARAKAASKRAYAPYSEFQVGAAAVVQNKRGEIYIYDGCNIENAAYGPTNCAERTAIFSAIAVLGEVELLAMAVYTPTETATPPCGVCRQVMNEFGPTATVIYSCDKEVKETTVDKLLPDGFGPKNLGK